MRFHNKYLTPFAVGLVLILLLSAAACSREDQQDLNSSTFIPPTGSDPCSPSSDTSNPCSVRDVSDYNFFAPEEQGAAFAPSIAASVEDVLEKGLNLAEMSPVHLAVRATATGDSVRCTWRGIARTTDQREQTIRYFLRLEDSDPLPAPAEVESRFLVEINSLNPAFPETLKANFKAIAWGGLSTDYLFLSCYASYTVHEYLLGSGTGVVPVAFGQMGDARSYALYSRAHAAGEFGSEPLTSENDHQIDLNRQLRDVEQYLKDSIGGSESVLFLAPMGAHHAIAVEAWQVIEQWDLQTDDSSVVQAVRYGVAEGDPEHTQTLANLKSRITTAAASDAYSDDRIGNVSGLRQYYQGIGAYMDITPGDGESTTFTPSPPPAVYAPKPATLTATLSGTTGANLSWGTVTGATGYHVQSRLDEDDAEWSTLDDSVTGTTYAASDLLCESDHELRVGAYGDGTTYNIRAGLWSDVASLTTGACNSAPTFTSSRFSLSISENAMVNASVGTVAATDVDTGDTVTHSITEGNEDGKFSINTSTGQITVAGELDPDEVAYYWFTVEANDGNGAVASTEVSIALLLTECSNGTVVERPRSNPRLVQDCSMLLSAKDTLAGSATLNWSASTRINDWNGVTVTPRPVPYVRVLLLTEVGLTGSIPAALGGLEDVRRIDLDYNSLTGEIPRELGSLRDLELLYLTDNELSGGIPAELGELRSLKTLFLGYNTLTGEIPAELGRLSRLKELILEDNSLTGGIPVELGDLSNLQSLYLSENTLTGGIPAELGQLRNLKHLVVERNSLGGDIPPELGNLTRLVNVYLRNNGLTGAIPAEWGELTNLMYFFISSGNSFTGCIPTGLRDLDVDNNDLAGSGLSYCSSPGS